MSNGTIVLTHITRQDLENGQLASRRHGCGAVVSRDNGQTWDIKGRRFLNEFECRWQAKYDRPSLSLLDTAFRQFDSDGVQQLCKQSSRFDPLEAGRLIPDIWFYFICLAIKPVRSRTKSGIKALNARLDSSSPSINWQVAATSSLDQT
jgi:hypothetical protein